jgi:UDP-N-acetylglucosamine 4,6-dehydratase
MTKNVGFMRSFGDGASAFKDHSLLITGGTGSFGRRLTETILSKAPPRRLIVFSRDELKQFDMQQELREKGLDLSKVRFFLGDVRDENRLLMAMNGIDTVIHTAALKQVPAAEYNPFECIHTNVLGAENVVRAAIRSGVKKVVALSTDKASAPINLYGASKLAADKIFVAANNLSNQEPRCLFSVVRYGNVMGSRGSVVPFFRRLLDRGTDHLPITDERMTRFWITLDQGVQFVISSWQMMQGGEIFIPKIPSTKITDLAQAMAPGMPLKTVGIRPGEKLHESMITAEDARTTVELPDRYIIDAQFPTWRNNEQEYHGGKAVDEFFSYNSESNPEWLSTDELQAWLEHT